MSLPRRLVAAIILAPALIIVACGDSPTDIGLGLVDVQAGAPHGVALESTSFDLDDDADRTGGYLEVDLSTGNLVPLGAARILAGHVDDPDLGLLEARGHMDFIPRTSVGDEFRNGTLTRVRLNLVVDYVYGDTLTPITLRLSEIQGSWRAAGGQSDTVISGGPGVVDFTLSPVDAAVVVELPEAWVLANAGMLQSETLSSDFPGFQIAPVDGNAIVGFNRVSSLFELAVPGDTLRMGFDELLTTVERTSLPVPSEYLLLQDGIDVASVRLDFDREEFTDSSVHSAIFRVDAVAPGLSSPAGFVRPPLPSLDLIAITAESGQENRLYLATGDVDDEGRVSFSSSDLVTAMQNTARGVGSLVGFELAAPVSTHSLNALFLKRSSADGGPRMILTVTELN